MDRASGAIVRFRLGGNCFPPTIYYKIFTKTAICDVGAFAPRTYTGSQQPSQEFLHSKAVDENGREVVSDAAVRVGKKMFAAKVKGAFPEEDGSSEWYLRTDRNGWRSVAAKTLEDVRDDPVTRKTTQYQLPYHYSKLKRSKNKVAERKKAKREWMRKLYGLGLANEKDDVSRQRSQLIRIAVNNRRELEPQDEEYLFDFDSETWEQDADAMLEWSEALDFEEYMNDWRTVATSEAVDIDGNAVTSEPAQ